MTAEPVGRPMEILLIEDSLADARLTIEALKEGGVQHRLTLVRDGLEAVEFLRQKDIFARAPRPDLILLDLGLPRMHGRDVLTEIRSDEELKDIPVVVLTISKDHEDILRNQRLHVEAYLTKPVDFATFVNVVKELKKMLAADVILPSIE
uniref:Response regulator n=1 Tax=uncultured bacterium FLS18 TaxID=654935 RepID=C6G411_9BACT|nr:response regulator [uncultured bacterium FLS18]